MTSLGDVPYNSIFVHNGDWYVCIKENGFGTLVQRITETVGDNVVYHVREPEVMPNDLKVQILRHLGLGK